MSWLVAAIAGALALVQTLVLVLRRRIRRISARRRQRRAHRAERRAEDTLRAHGYQVLDRQVRTEFTVRCDGKPLRVGLRADLLASRRGKRFVAEVKSGSLAPRLDHAPTRRQLIEYGLAFETAGVLLVDAERGTVHTIEIESRGRTLTSAVRLVIIGILMGICAGIAWIQLS